MKIILPLIVATLLVSLASCDKDSSEIINNKAKFLGEYNIESIHISGIVTEYDSIGNIIFQGFDTTTVSNELLTITEIASDNDTLVIQNLINSFSHTGPEVRALVSNDTINIIYDFSFPYSNDFIKGNIWFEDESILLDYYWDKSDTWSEGALPVRGMVKGREI